MLRKEKSSKVRKNRMKRDVAMIHRRWRERLLIGFKLTSLIVLLMATSALYVMVYAAVTGSDYFGLRNISLSGNQRLSEKEILAQADIHPGDNLVALNLRLVRDRLLAHPWIATARVSREIPEALNIQIMEHSPLARIDLGRTFLINAEGRIFKEAEDNDPQDIPLVTGMAYSDISLGKDALTAAMQTALQVLRYSRAASSAIGYPEIKRLHMDKQIGVSITLKQSERIIKMGFDDFEKKSRRYKQLRSHLEADARWRDFQAVDLNNPDRVVVRLSDADHPLDQQ
jgi:cell division protein FtsQ